MRKPKKNSGIWEYLASVGKLDSSEDEMKQARIDYRKLYEKEYKAERRKQAREYVVSLKPNEVVIIGKAAQEHGLKRGAYIRKAAVAYSEQAYLVPQRHLVDQILQLLLRCQVTIQGEMEKDQGGWFKADRKYAELENAVIEMRSQILSVMVKPPLLISEILKAIKSDPVFKQQIITFIRNYDPQKPDKKN
jgi:hypothetical protein